MDTEIPRAELEGGQTPRTTRRR